MRTLIQIGVDADAWSTRVRVRLGFFTILVALTPTEARAQPAGSASTSAPTDFATPATPSAPHVDEPIVRAVAGGLTAEVAARRAIATSFSARAAQATATAASARQEGAKLDYIPQTTLIARYTRISPYTNPLVSGGVETTAAPGTVNPAVVASEPTRYPVFENQYLLQANVTVPLTDYIFKIRRSYSAATSFAEAARFDVVAARAAASVAAKRAYYDWLRGIGGLVVAEQTLAVATAHANDARLLFRAGSSSSADVLRAEAAVAAAELVVERAKAIMTSTEWNLKTLTHAPEEEHLDPGESLDAPLPPLGANLHSILNEAYANRAEIKSTARNIEAARELISVARADRAPALSAFGDLIYANPNNRTFPPTADFVPSWQIGALLTWSPKKYLVAGTSSADQEARASALESQLSAARDAVVREVVDAYSTAVAADAGIRTTARQLDAAREAYRVSRVLYNGGRATGTTLLDAEYALAQARFDHLNARTDARVARVQLEHAAGRDMPSSPDQR